MIDIYDNLEDYEEISHYEQLKSENQELKLKLDQCEAARRKLQQEILQDFDKLAAEHNILLQNFSSLLKTARAEVERKTDTITHINAEKDKLFISLMSDSTNKVNRTERRKSKIRKQSGGPVEICDLKLDSRSLKEVSKEKDDQLERKQPPSNEHQPLTQTKPKIKAANSVYKVANKHNAERGNKENEAERKQDTTVEKFRPCSIRNRRKSMPVLRHELSKFCSEDEDEPERVEHESERNNKAKYRSSESSNVNDNCSDTRQLGSKTRSQTKPHNETFKDKHVRQSRYDVHESYRKEERNEDKSGLKERRGRSSYGRLRESRHRSRGSHRESEDYDYRQENDRRASPPYDKYHRYKSRERRSYRYNERDESITNFEEYKLLHNEKPKKTRCDKGAENFEHNIGRNVETYHDKPDDIADQHKQSKNKSVKDDRNVDRNEKHDNSIDSYTINSNKKLAERDEPDKLKITQATVSTEMPNLCDKSKKYKIPKISSQKVKQDVNKKDEKYDHAIDKYNATIHERLVKHDFHRSLGRCKEDQERPNNAVDLNSPISFVNSTETHHDLNINVKEHDKKCLENSDYEIDSHKLTHRERLAKKHDYDLERNLKTHPMSELQDFDTNVQTCDETPTEELISRRNRPITVFDRRMTRNIGKQSQHKVLVDTEEPVSKRRRTSSYGLTDEVNCHENVTVNILDKASIEFGHRFVLTSCQSPDDILADNVTADESMREIMNTAETKLEDPRYTSNRYVTVGDTTNKIRLSVSSRHVHMYKLSWPLDKETKGNQIPEHTAETKSQECNREPTNEHSNQNNSYKGSPEINSQETEVEIVMPIDSNVLNESLESGEIEDVYSDLITTVGPNESTEQTAKPQTSPNFGIQGKDDISQISESSVFEEIRKCRKYEIPKTRPDIVNALPIKNSLMPLEELLKPTSSDCGYIHKRHPVGLNTELSSFGVSKESESLKVGKKLEIPQLQDLPMPLAELFKPSTASDTARNKQHIEILAENQPDSSSETSKNYKIPQKTKFEKIPNAPEIKEPQIFDDCSSYKQISGPHTFEVKPQKCSKVVTNIRNSAEKIEHSKSDALQLKESKNLRSHIIDTPAKKSLVQGDLELSDEDSDNCDLHSQNTLEKLISSSKSYEIKNNKRNTIILKIKESEQKPDKTGKKIENSKTTDVKVKFCDLFGETSLITPEDLEIPPERVKETFSDYVFSPISEFAQMADNADCNPVQVHEEKTNKSKKTRTRSGKVKKDSDYDKKTHQKDDKKSRKVSKSTTDRVVEKSEKHILPKKRKNVEKTKKASTEDASINTIEVDAIKVIPEKNDKIVMTSSGKQPPPTVTKNNESIIFTETPKLTQMSDDSRKALASFTSAGVPTSIALAENSSVERTTGNYTSAHGKQPPTVTKHNESIIFTETPKLTQMSDSIKSLASFTSARVPTSIALAENSSVDRTTGNYTSAQSVTNHVSESNTTEDEPDVRIVMTRRKRKRVSQ